MRLDYTRDSLIGEGETINHPEIAKNAKSLMFQ